MHFERQSEVHKALEAIARRLQELGIPNAIAGGIALFFHGHWRFTEDVVILVTAEGLREIHHHLAGWGYLRPFTGSQNLRDTTSGVRIKFLVTDHYPGDGKPKLVALPDPAAASVEIDGIQFLRLETLIELKLARAPGTDRATGYRKFCARRQARCPSVRRARHRLIPPPGGRALACESEYLSTVMVHRWGSQGLRTAKAIRFPVASTAPTTGQIIVSTRVPARRLNGSTSISVSSIQNGRSVLLHRPAMRMLGS